MAGSRDNMLPFLKICLKGFLYLVPEIYNGLIAALSSDQETVIPEVYILNIKPHTFGYTKASSQQKSKQRKIPDLRFFMELQLLVSEIFTVLHIVKKHGNLIRVEPYDLFFMKLWHLYQGGGILFDHFRADEIIIHTS